MPDEILDRMYQEMQDFITVDYSSKVLDYIRKGRPWIKIDFRELIRKSPSLADFTLDNPDEAFKLWQSAIDSLDNLSDKIIGMRPRFHNLPSSSVKNVWEVRSEDVGKLIGLKGIINKVGGVVHICSMVRLRCLDCSYEQMVPVLRDNIIYPKICKECGKKKPRWVIIDRKIYDLIRMGLLDDLMDKDNKDMSFAREKAVELSRDLASLEIDKLLKPGRKAIINGYLQYKEKAKDSKEFTTVMNANYIELVDVGWNTLTVDEKRIEQIKEASKQPDIIQRLAESVADVKGFKYAKIACLLQQAGAPNLYDSSGELISRGTVHVLLIGNPGGGKTYMAKRFGSLSPISMFQSAATASGRGMVAAAAQDKEYGGWVIYPGIVAMCHKGTVVIDEIDKTHPDDYGDHNNAMNDMCVAVAKGNAKAILDTETNYLATANPEHRIWVRDRSYFQQIDMPKDFLDRFDSVFPMNSPTDQKKKDEIMEVMLGRHLAEDREEFNPEFSASFVREYIAYCRRFIPTLSKSLFPYIKKKLHELMRPEGEEQDSISFRVLENISRFFYASARLRLRNVTKEDVDLAFELKEASFKDLGIITERGFSWAKLEDIEEEVISEKETIHRIVKEIVSEGKETEIQEIIDVCKSKGIDEDSVDEYIAKLKRKGDYYEPRRGWLKRL